MARLIGVDAQVARSDICPGSASTISNAAVNYTVQDSAIPAARHQDRPAMVQPDQQHQDQRACEYTGGNVPLFYTNAGRSFMVNFSVPFQ